jgi:2',3'-cyclic-nucleotide 2'-phosphodiesterase (5'-nucleotidase family)
MPNGRLQLEDCKQQTVKKVLFSEFRFFFTNFRQSIISISTLMRKFRFSLLLLSMLLFLACSTPYKVEKSQVANIHLDSLVTTPANAKMEAMIKPYRDKVNAGMTEVLCLSSEALYGGRPESKLTNLFADLTLEESNRYCAEKYPKIRMDVSMINRGGLRTSLPKGEIRTSTMFEMMPFENELVLLKLKGEVMLEFINHMASRGGEGVSGVRFGIKNDRALNPEIGGKPLDNAQSYWLVTSDYIANGGDGSEILSKSSERIDTGIKARDLFIGYFKRLGKEGKTVTAKTDGRIYDAK